jgi:hypothetical protein
MDPARLFFLGMPLSDRQMKIAINNCVEILGVLDQQ